LPVSGASRPHEDNGEEGYGNAGLWKTRKTKDRFSTVSHSPWKSPKRDSHIPTAPATTARKSGNPKAGFPLSRRGSCSFKEKTQKERRFPRTPGFPSFRLIVRLEYAKRRDPAIDPELLTIDH
jgi:hypothetical protein